MVENQRSSLASRSGPTGLPTMVAPDEALDLVLRATVRLPRRSLRPTEACGLRLAEPVRADRDYPPFARSMMDGYAACVEDAGKSVQVVGEVAAGRATNEYRVAVGTSVEIMTGAPCPTGTQAVVPKEEIVRQGDRVRLPERIETGQYIAPRGSECSAGQLVLDRGQTITPLMVAVMASFGMDSIEVDPRPSMAVITTGAELIGPDDDPASGMIRDSNGPMLLAMARDMAVDPPAHLRAGDRLEAILQAIEAVADRNVILLTGGVSAGRYDLVPEAVKRFGAEPIFHKVRQKPGKPLLVAKKGTQLIFGLPGNPLACHLCFHRYVAAAVRRMEGKSAQLPNFEGKLTEPVAPKHERTFFVPALAESSGEATAGWRLHPLPGVSSADMFMPARANCYVEVPPGVAPVEAGETVHFTWIGNAPWMN